MHPGAATDYLRRLPLMDDNTFKCRSGCGACCIAISISSPIPGLPHGKKAGVRCPHLAPDLRCLIFEEPTRPDVCAALRPSLEMCGTSQLEALTYLQELERLTAPDVVGRTF